MIVVHHLNNSRSQRILWLLEELEAPYEIKRYERNAMTRLAPPELRAVHPLGKSPVITDGDVTVAESGAIIEYLVDRLDAEHRLRPPQGSPAALDYVHLMHFAEGSAMLPFMLALYTGFLGEAAAPLKPRIDSEIENHLTYMQDLLGPHEFFVAGRFTAADVQVTFVLEAAASARRLEPYPALKDYLTRMQVRPAYLRAIDKGGPYTIGRPDA